MGEEITRLIDGGGVFLGQMISWEFKIAHSVPQLSLYFVLGTVGGLGSD